MERGPWWWLTTLVVTGTACVWGVGQPGPSWMLALGECACVREQELNKTKKLEVMSRPGKVGSCNSDYLT